MRKVDAIILGAGPAGLSAAVYLARNNVDFIILEKNFQGGQIIGTPEVDNYIGFADGISGMDLGEAFYKHATRFGAEIVYDEIEDFAISKAEKILTSKTEKYVCEALIIATGARPAKLGIKGEAELLGKGISFCATCDGAFFRNKAVCVVGGGNTAVEDALYLSSLCEKVYLIHRRDELRAEAELASKLESHKNIEILYDTEVLEFNGEKNLEKVKIINKKTKNEKELELAGAFIAVGIKPNSEVFERTVTILPSKFIETDENLQTNINGVFAVGDVRNTPLRQVITAAADGAIAATSVVKYLA